MLEGSLNSKGLCNMAFKAEGLIGNVMNVQSHSWQLPREQVTKRGGNGGKPRKIEESPQLGKLKK